MREEKISSQYRMSAELHAKLVSAAKRNGNSINSELVGRIARSFDTDEKIDLLQRLNTLQRQQKRNAEIIAQLAEALINQDLLKEQAEKDRLTKNLNRLLSEHSNIE